MNTFYIIDGSAYLYRAYYAIRELSTRQGLPTNAVYGFCQMLLKIIKDKKPDYLAIAFDSKGPTFRHKIYENYKAHRPAMPDPLAVQIPYIHKMVEAFRIPALIEEGYEADDLIGTLARQGESNGLAVVIVSGDKDMFQLISPAITVYDSMKDRLYTEKEITERFGFGPSQVVEMMGLMGDAVDNIPGVTGIGEKTAIQLIQEFGDIENLLSHLDQVKKLKLRETLYGQQEIARLSRTLAQIDTRCPMAFHPEQFRIRPPDRESLMALCKELEFSTLLKEFNLSLPQPLKRREIAIISEMGEAIEAIQRSQKVAIALRATPDHPTEATLSAIAFSSERGKAYYLPVSGPMPSGLAAIFESESVLKCGHDLKEALLLLKKCGVACKGPLLDTMIASYLLNPGQRDHALERVALAHAPAAPEEVAEDTPSRLCREAETILQLSECLPDLLSSQSLLSLFYDMEMPLVPVLAKIEQNGVKINASRLISMSKEIDARLSTLTERIHHLAGGPFNVNSPKQLAEILFERLHLPPIRKTKTGYSTDEDVLTRLAAMHELPSEILHSRQLTKLKSTYIDALPKLVCPATGRIHTQLNQTITATGRLSSKEPNLQNIPIRGDLGRKIRSAFIAEEGILLSADYNQIELRILAHLSEDAHLMEAFKRGEDIHAQTAAQIFGLMKEDITSEMRRVAKTVNFGIIYGISPFGLSVNLGVSQTEAKRYIDRYFEHYQGVRQFIDQTLEVATRQGYVTTLFHRRRDIPELSSKNRNTRGSGERLAINTPIQGSAADIIKLAMIAIDRRMRQEAVSAKMILQVHDELIFEVPEAEVTLMREMATQMMEEVVRLKVPLKVNVGVGENWGEIH